MVIYSRESEGKQAVANNLDEISLIERLADRLPLLVAFHAPWCAMCQAQTNNLERLEVEKSPNYKIARVDVDQQPHLAERFSITVLPTLMLFQHGALVARLEGLRPEHYLRETLHLFHIGTANEPASQRNG